MNQTIDFEAVVLGAGKGSRMLELTAGKPKCLLPVGNFPMIWYPLKLLEKSGFTSALIIVLELSKSEIMSALDQLNFKLKLEFFGISEDDLGTADSLRIIHERIRNDCLVISCDLIADINLKPLLNLYRRNRASIVSLMFPVPKITEDFILAGPKTKQKTETDLIGIENGSNRLVFFASASDFEENVLLPRKLMQEHQHFNIYSQLLDAHLYIINKCILKSLALNRTFGSIKGDLLPYVISQQLRKSQRNVAEDRNTSIVKEDILQFCNMNPLEQLTRDMSSFCNDCNENVNDSSKGNVKCYVYKVSERSGLRVNTIQMYSLANSAIDKLWNFSSDESQRIHPNASVKSTQVQGCRVDNNSSIDQKTSLRGSNIGVNVKVEAKTRVIDSIVMDNVSIGQKCVIINCILCNGCIIEEGTELTNCLVGSKFIVSSGSKHSQEILTDSSELMEI